MEAELGPQLVEAAVPFRQLLAQALLLLFLGRQSCAQLFYGPLLFVDALLELLSRVPRSCRQAIRCCR
jgi:hypothetical protein